MCTQTRGVAQGGGGRGGGGWRGGGAKSYRVLVYVPQEGHQPANVGEVREAPRGRRFDQRAELPQLGHVPQDAHEQVPAEMGGSAG